MVLVAGAKIAVGFTVMDHAPMVRRVTRGEAGSRYESTPHDATGGIQCALDIVVPSFSI